MKRTTILIGLLLAGIVSAAAAAGPWAGIDVIQRWMKGGFYVGSAATASTENKITNSIAVSQAYDFPACAAYGAGTVTACHQNTPAFTMTGVAVGDPCFVSSFNTVADGGMQNDTTFDAVPIGANSVVLRMHSITTDAGVTNLPDAGFFIRCFSNR